MGKITIMSLERDFVESNINGFLQLEEEFLRQLGPEVPRWDVNNYLQELPEKWRYSRVAIEENGCPIGFIIASNDLPGNIHIHRMGVAPAYQGRGVYKKMATDMWNAIKQDGYKTNTAFVAVYNAVVWRYLVQHGFKVLIGVELFSLLELKHREEEICNGAFLISGEPYYVMQRDL